MAAIHFITRLVILLFPCLIKSKYRFRTNQPWLIVFKKQPFPVFWLHF